MPQAGDNRNVAKANGLGAGTRRLQASIGAAAIGLMASPALSHPHVFVDGGVDFLLRGGPALEALEVNWLYDEFETLYILSSYGLSLNADGDLDEQDRQELVRARSKWPEDFDGSAHLSVDGQAVSLEWPTSLDVRLIDGRLEVTFERRLHAAIPVQGKKVEVAFYESTYFFDFTVTRVPEILGGNTGCATEVIPFNPNNQLAELQSVLAQLSREETPAEENVGALFADRIILKCD
ncbi:MAG: DUF1007 family protein [Pseudomonadota bacterium]